MCVCVYEVATSWRGTESLRIFADDSVSLSCKVPETCSLKDSHDSIGHS